jgi:hypothetical protein|tara:strand:+ start:273 stop:524 length:252 start_codon:yes stop_codon:yes gene_type:complete
VYNINITNQGETMNDLLKEWVRIDDACEVQEDGTIESFHCTDNGQEELEFIIERLRALYAAGGAVQKIVIDELNSNSGTLNNV